MELRELAPRVPGSTEEVLGKEEHCRNLGKKRVSSGQYKDKILKEER